MAVAQIERSDVKSRVRPPESRLPRTAQSLLGLVAEGPVDRRAFRRFGEVFAIDAYPFERLVAVCDPAEIKRLWALPPDQLDAGQGNAVLGPLVGRSSVLLLDGEKHLTTRRALLPPFHGERMQGLVEVMRAEAEAEVETWPLGRPFALLPCTQRLTLRIILRTVFGVDGDRLVTLQEALGKMTTLGARVALAPGPVRRFGTPPFVLARADVDRLLGRELAEGGAPGSVLAELAALDQSPEWVRDQLLTLLIAGHETTATALAWAFERLTRAPDVHRQAVAAARGEGETGYLDQVIHETLRSRPPLNWVMRHIKTPLTVGGYDIPAGWTVGAALAVIHQRPDLFPEPEAFRPERFADGTNPVLAWLPFGGGRRRCLGAAFALAEMRQVLGTVLRRLDLTAPDPRPEWRRRRAITFVPHRGARVIARRPA
jgi:cytochrome P450